MSRERVRLFPTAIQTVAEATPGPVVDGEAALPGDVLCDAGGDRRVVTGTGFGPTNERVELFDPAGPSRSVRSRRTFDTGGWSVVRRALGVTTGLGPDSRQQVLGYASYDPKRAQYRCECGATPIGGSQVRLDADPVVAATPAALRTAIERGDGTIGPFRRAAGVDSAAFARDCIETSRRRLSPGETVPAEALSVTGVVIPTGEDGPAVEPDEGPPTYPGDRFVYWPDGHPPATPTDADRETLANGRCLVVLGPSGESERITCHDVVTDDRRELSPAAIRRERARADECGHVLRLLARGCFVDSLGAGQTYSVHAYTVGGEDGPAALLSGSLHPTTEPRLEHPLAMPTTTFEFSARLIDGLETPARLAHPLAEWATAHEKVTALSRRLANRVRRTSRRR